MSSCQPASSAPLLPLPAPQLNSIEISQAMNIFALLVPLTSPLHPWHPCPLPGIAFCQCIDPTCILWSKLAFDIYAGCQADGQRLKILPLLSPSLSPATPLDHCHQRELDEKREREREKEREREPRPFVLVIVTCVFCFCFPLRFSLSLFSSKVCLQNYRYPGRRRGLGQRSQPFWPFQLPPKLFSRVRQMHPGGRFHFVICVFDILLKCC